MITNFDKTAEYNAKIMPLIRELMRACNEEKIPMFVTVCVKNNDEGTIYENDTIGVVINDLKLKDDKFSHLANVMNGFDTVPHNDLIEIDFN